MPEVEERSPLEEKIVDGLREEFRDWLEEEGINEVMGDGAREGAVEPLEGAMPFWREKADKANPISPT